MSEPNLLNILSTEHGDNDDDDDMPVIFRHSPYYNSDDALSLLQQKQNTFSILSLNCQSLQSKFDQLKIYIESFNHSNCPFSIICLQETWLSDYHDLSLLQLEGYKLLHQPRTCSAHGGVAIYVQMDLECKILQINGNREIWDGLFIEVSGMQFANQNVGKVVIGNIYRPPRELVENYATFTDEIENIISAMTNSNKEIIILGDFNLDLLKINESQHVNNFFETMVAHGYIPKITCPTRITQNSCTLIDNCYVKLSSNFSKTTAGILNYNISDHQPYFVTLDYLVMPKHKSRLMKIYTNSAEAYQKFIEELSQTCEKEKFNNNLSTDPNVNYEMLDNLIQNASKKCLPAKYVRYDKYRHKKNGWITQGILKSIKFRDKMYITLRAMSITNPDYERYKVNLQTYNKILRKNIRLAKKTFYHQCFFKFKNDIKSIWTTIKQIINKSCKGNDFPDHFLINGSQENKPQVIANAFNKYFIEIGPKLARAITPPHNKSYKDFLTHPTSKEFKFINVNEEEVKKVIENLKPKSSSGVDGISNKLLKLSKDIIAAPYALIINQSFTTGIYPDKLKIGKVLPIYKKEENYLFDNYRPVSLLPSLSKIIEKVIYKQLYNYFNSNNLFYQSQYGFRSNHSTELAALELLDRIVTKLDNNEIPINIYLDLSKAFDTLDHNILIQKLQYYGITRIPLLLLQNYLKNRKQYVQFGEITSDYQTIQTGVPQGSILGPLLFTIYLNDISAASQLFIPIIYADDTALSATLSIFGTGNSMVDNINSELSGVNDWLQLNKLSLNINKTKAMIFHNPQKKVDKINIKLNDIDIEFVDQFNYLGIILDKHLSWKPHIQRISQKVCKTVGVMNKLKNTVPTSVLLTLYNSLILPYFNYGILAWGTKCHNLFKLQKRAVRVILSAKYNAHTAPIFKQLQILRLSDLCALQELKFIHKMENKNLPHYFNNMEFRRHSDVHSYNTRNASNYETRLSYHSFVNKSICFRIPNIFNNCPTLIKNKIYTHSITGFTKYVKNYYLSSYIEDCTIPNCYICQNSS